MAGKAARLSEAHQFFTAQDAETQSADTDTTSERVIDLLNQAQLATSENKLSYLKQVQELIINKDPTLLDNFLDEILVFHQDRSSDVRRFVVGFVEEACKKDPILLTKAIGTLAYMLDDDNVNVMKRVMLACTSMYKVSLQLVCKQRTIKEDVNLMWQGMTELRKMLCGLVKSDNDGVRTHAIKFMEMLVLVHSLKSQDNDVPKKEGDVSLDIVPRNHPLVKLNELREEGSQTLESLLTLCGSPTISSVNLMAVLGTLSNIAKQRPIFMSTVVQAFESLHANLPPTLAKSQVSSVRKNLKMQLFSLLKHPAAIDYVPQIGTLLTDLGATQSELQKNLPKVTPEQLKRPRPTPAAEPSSSKKSKTEAKPEPSSSSTTSAVATLSKAADITTAELIPLLSKDVVTDLVLVSMLFLPKTMPSHFQETFTPIAAAGGKAQVAHLARLMATQMTNAGIGSGVEKVKQMAEEEARAKKEAEEKASREPKSIPVIGASAEPDEQEPIDSKKPFQSHPGFGVDQKETNSRSTQDSTSDTGRQSRQITAQPTDVPHLRIRKIKPFKLQDVTRSLNVEERNRMILGAYKRILNGEKSAIQGGATMERNRLLVGLALQFGGELTATLQTFILDDFRNRYDLAMTWLFQEYIKEEAKAPKSTSRRDSKYSRVFIDLLLGLQQTLDPKDKLFTRFILEAPGLSESVIDIIKRYCEDPERYLVGFATLRELIMKYPAMQHFWLQLLLELTTREKEQVRVQAIHSAKKLHSKVALADVIEKFALHSLQQLLRDHPPPQEGSTATLEIAPGKWTDDAIKACLYLYLALLPTNHSLFHDLAEVYTEASPLIKRTILRHLEHPVRAIGMNSPELLKLVEKCPSGAETLVTRVLHIITDKNAPTPELVRRVKELYQKRVSDVRFLIPVLNGLDKQEILAVLPKLITQSPNVVKEVFNRLLGSYQPESATVTSPLTPSELLIALHSIESKSDMKAVMKAINLCFAEKHIYTQEVIAVVLQQLMEQSPLPTLFMRTVILSLSMCPRLVGFVMNILAKLINKQVWKQPKVWQGFVKCCQMTKPQSFPILLQLPPRQLESVFEMSSELRDQLIAHVQRFTPNQRAHIPRSVLQVIETEIKHLEARKAKTEDSPDRDPSVKKRRHSSKREKKLKRSRSKSSDEELVNSDEERENKGPPLKIESLG